MDVTKKMASAQMESAEGPPAPSVAAAKLTDPETFRLFVASVSDYAIYMLSPEGYIRSWNAGAERFKGYSQDEIIGQHFSRFYTPEDRAANKPIEALKAALRNGTYEAEGWRLRKDGTRFWAHVVIDPIHDENGKLLGFAKITRDITEKQEARQALERTREALFHAQKLEAIGKLTGGVAHDFNNLLAVITNGIEILRLQQRVDSRVLDSMQRAVNQGASLNQQLLTFARQQPLQPERNDINRLIGNFEAVLTRMCAESIQFNLKLAHRLKPVEIDSTQFEAALLNLVSNARDAMPEGGRLTVATANVALQDNQVNNLPAGDYVRVSVQDTGSGMSPEVISQAIDPFFTTKPPGEGTGMGLSQVYGLVQQSGGDLHIDSSPGEGSTISLYLPVMQGELPDDEDSTEAEADDCLVLLVDDQPDVLAMAVELFRILGYDTLAASSGEEALDILDNNPEVEILLTDVVMPGMDGVQLGQEALRRNPDMVVLLASGYPGDKLAEKNANMKDFPLIAKPYRTADLLKILRQFGK